MSVCISRRRSLCSVLAIRQELGVAHWTNRHGAIPSASKVALLHLVNGRDCSDPGQCVHVAHPSPKIGEVGDVLFVQLHPVVVDGVVAEDSREEAHIGFRDAFAAEEGRGREQLLYVIQSSEVVVKGLRVNRLLAAESGLVSSIVDAYINEGVQLIDALLQLIGVEIQMAFRAKRAEGPSKHAQDLAALVVDNA